MICPNSAIKRTIKLYNDFKSIYVKSEFQLVFEKPDVFALSYNLDKIDPNTHTRARCKYTPCYRNKHTIVYNHCFWRLSDNSELEENIEDYIIIHEFAHYITDYESFRMDKVARCYKQMHISDETILKLLKEPYTDEYFDWNDCLWPMWCKFIESIYVEHDLQNSITMDTFLTKCERSYSHLSFAFYRACYLCWRLYYKDRKRGIIPFAFRRILGYDSDDLQQQLVYEVLGEVCKIKE